MEITKIGKAHPSHTAKQAVLAKATISAIITKLKISKQAWYELLFEYGMQFLWNNYSYKDSLSIAQSEDCRFWDAWMEVWIDDDSKILPWVNGWDMYCMLKFQLTEKSTMSGHE